MSDPQDLDPAEEPGDIEARVAGLPDVDDDVLAEAMSVLDPADLVQGADHPYDPALDPESEPPWQRP